MKITFPPITKAKEQKNEELKTIITYYFLDLTWHTLLPITITIIAFTYHPAYFFLLILPIIIRLEK